MDRAIPCGNKVCMQRVQQRSHDLHRERVRKIKAIVDTKEPAANHMDHVRLNLKKEQQLEDKYSEIDRENRCLLQKMSTIMKQQTTPREEQRQPGPQSLNRGARKQELLRITKENQSILKRIQQAQPVYNHVEWEGANKRHLQYMRNCAEYPLVLRTPRAQNKSSELVPLDPEDSDTVDSARSPVPRGSMSAREGEKHVRVLSERRKINDIIYHIDMQTDGKNLYTSAYDTVSKTTLELVVRDRMHRKLYRETNGDYSAVAKRLRVEGNRLILDDDAVSPRMPPRPPQSNANDELDADAMVQVYKTKSGSAGSVDAQVEVPTTGDPFVRVRA